MGAVPDERCAIADERRVLGPAGERVFDLHAQERATIEQALEQCRGNRRETAKALKISPFTLWRKMKTSDLPT